MFDIPTSECIMLQVLQHLLYKGLRYAAAEIRKGIVWRENGIITISIVCVLHHTIKTRYSRSQ